MNTYRTYSLLLILNLISIAQAYSQTAAVSLPIIYEDTVEKFSISFPERWEIIPNHNGAYIMGGGPVDTSLNDQMIRGGFGLSISHYKKPYKLEDFYANNIREIREAYPDLKILEESTVTIDKTPGKYVVLECTLYGMTIVSIQYYFIKNNTGYIMNAAATPVNLNAYKDLYSAIAKSYKWI